MIVMSKFKKGQRVYFLIANETYYSAVPIVEIRSGTVTNIAPTYQRGYVEIKSKIMSGYGKNRRLRYTWNVYRNSVTLPKTKDNYKILERRAAKFIVSCIKNQLNVVSNIRQKYKHILQAIDYE